MCHITCNATRSCDSVHVISNRDVNITCQVDQACEGTNITVESEFDTSNITVNIQSISGTDAPISDTDGGETPRIYCDGNGIEHCNLLCGIDSGSSGNKACENVIFTCNTPNYCNIECGFPTSCRFDNNVCMNLHIFIFV